MATVWIPPHHRDLTAGAERVTASGATIRAVIADLDAQFPGIAARLVAGQKLRPGIAVAVDGVVAPDGLRRRLTAPSEIHFVPAMAGG
jgi:molybdopterin converting factor small subunit